jgi:hypothetical protein
VFDKTGSFVFTGKQYNVDLKAKGWERLEIWVETGKSGKNSPYMAS